MGTREETQHTQNHSYAESRPLLKAKQLSELGGGNNDTDARRLLTTLQCAVPRPHCLPHTHFFPSRQPRAASKVFRLIVLA